MAVWSGLTSKQKSVVLASYLGWTLDAFDFFLLVFVLDDIAKEFQTDVSAVSLAIVLTLAARPLGALLFGLAADHYGRRPVLMIDILSFSLLEFASGFAPGLAAFLALRALFGVAMGGEWGVGASLTMETIPAQARGAISGLLQVGYPSGYLTASVAYFLFYGILGWRGLFILGALPALLVLYIRGKVEESPVFLAKGQKRERASLATLQPYAGRFLYAVALMTAFNFLSHGTQDLYPTFLRVQKDFDPHTVGVIAIVYNIGAILGGLFFGALSERVGRRRGMVIAAFVAFLLIPFWAYGTGQLVLAVGAFLMQFAVQGAWGIVPVYLNELSPKTLRGTFPGFAYQTGNLLASVNATLQARLASSHDGDYAFALAIVAATVTPVLAAVASIGREARGVSFSAPEEPG